MKLLRIVPFVFIVLLLSVAQAKCFFKGCEHSVYRRVILQSAPYARAVRVACTPQSETGFEARHIKKSACEGFLYEDRGGLSLNGNELALPTNQQATLIFRTRCRLNKSCGEWVNLSFYDNQGRFDGYYVLLQSVNEYSNSIDLRRSSREVGYSSNFSVTPSQKHTVILEFK